MNVFIDLGCFDGDSIRQFYGWSHLDKPYIDFHIYGFDPTNRHDKVWRSMESENDKLKFESKAAYTYDGKIEFTQRPKDAPLGSTVMQTKADYGMGEVFEVDCFDFSKWLKQFKEDDYIIVKMDIEGSEYEVLSKMLEDGTDKLIDKLLVEWHDKKLSTDNSKTQEYLIKNLRCEVLPWL